jgi:chromosome segregation ATPase
VLHVRVEYVGRQIICNRCEHLFHAQPEPSDTSIFGPGPFEPRADDYQTPRGIGVETASGREIQEVRGEISRLTFALRSFQLELKSRSADLQLLAQTQERLVTAGQEPIRDGSTPGNATSEEVEQLQSRIRELELTLEESNARLEAAHLDNHRQLESARALWAKEQAERFARWEGERESFAETVNRYEAERNQAIAEKQISHERQAAWQRHLEQDRKSFRAELEALHCVVECLRNERDKARQNTEELRRERDEAHRRFHDLEQRQKEGDSRHDPLRETLDGQAREFETELQQFREEAAAREESLRKEIATLRRDLDAQAQERDLAFQEAGCLRLENEEVRLHQAELQRARVEAEQRHQEAIARFQTAREEKSRLLDEVAHAHQAGLDSLRDELESRHREELDTERKLAETRWKALLAEVDTLRASLAERSSEADAARREVERLAGREAGLSGQTEFLSETLARQGREFDAERQALHLTLASLQQVLEAKAAGDEAALAPGRAPGENGSDSHSPLLVPHVEHATPPPPHGLDHESAGESVPGSGREPEPPPTSDARLGEHEALANVPGRFRPDLNDYVEDQSRALRQSLLEVRTAEPIDPADQRGFTRLSGGFRPA